MVGLLLHPGLNPSLPVRSPIHSTHRAAAGQPRQPFRRYEHRIFRDRACCGICRCGWIQDPSRLGRGFFQRIAGGARMSILARM